MRWGVPVKHLFFSRFKQDLTRKLHLTLAFSMLIRHLASLYLMSVLVGRDRKNDNKPAHFEMNEHNFINHEQARN